MRESQSVHHFTPIGPYDPNAGFGALEEQCAAILERDIARKHEKRFNLLQCLIRVQYHQGWLSPDALSWLASQTDMSVSEIEGIIDFYAFLERSEPKPYQLRFSTNITELWQGQRRNIEDCLSLHNASVSETSCTGMGDQGPAALLNGFPLTRLTPERMRQIREAITQKRLLEHWPAEWFQVESGVRQKGPLLNFDFQPGQLLQGVMCAGANQLLSELQDSGLRGRGGAGFSTFVKWSSCAQAAAHKKYVVCNADEGEPGTFKDRLLLAHYPHTLLEGMTIAGFVLGAQKGFIYLRGEYLFLYHSLQHAIEERRALGLLGSSVAGNAGFQFDIDVHLGAGAYVCGEESALLESLEGKRGIPRIRPPYPVTHGYRQYPTVINNVETFCQVALLQGMGLSAFKQLGNRLSSGTKLHSISGDCERPGVYEFEMGVPVNSLLDACGARQAQAVQVGGPSGKLLLAQDFDTPIDFEHVSSGGSFMVIGQDRDLLELTANFTHFFRHESCGFCTPCRVGSSLLANTWDKVCRGQGSEHDIHQLEEVIQVAEIASHCGLGHTIGNPVKALLTQKRDLVTGQLSGRDYTPVFDPEEAVAEAAACAKRGVN